MVEPVPGDWPEGLWLARLYAAAYQISLPAAVDLVYGRPAGEAGWLSGPCPDQPAQEEE